MELNTRCSEGYRRYSSDVPKYLHNKPRPFVNHCRQRITSAAEVDLQDIKELYNGPKVGQFQVRSQSRNTGYNSSFGAGEVMPRCSCPDFCHTGLRLLVPRVSHRPANWSERGETLVWSGHVPPKIWDVTNRRLVGGGHEFKICLYLAKGRAVSV